MKRITSFLLSFSVKSFFAIGVISSFVLLTLNDLPSASELNSTSLKAPLRIFSAEKELIAEFGDERRKNIDLDNAPKPLLNAILASEDTNFYKHFGIDFKGILRAVIKNMTSGSKQGASTITQQVARNYFLSSEQTYKRKLREVMLAFKIEATLSKDEIFELYINKIFLGHRSYGFAAAANVYYGKELSELSIAQHAMLAGLPKAPSRHNPISNPSRAEKRRNYVLQRLLDNDWITEAEYSEAIETPVTAQRQKNPAVVNAPYVAEISRQFILDKFGKEAYWTGINVYTNIEKEYQEAANRALRKGLLSYDKRHGYRGPTSSLKEEPKENWPEKLADIQPSGDISPAVITSTSKDSITVLSRNNETIKILLEDSLWAKKQLSTDSVGNKITDFRRFLNVADIVYIEPIKKESLNSDSWRLSQLPQVQGAIVATEAKSGNVVALAGGFDFYFNNYNRVTQARRQPGSSLKPFIYAAALEKGYQPYSKISGAPIVIEDVSQGTVWKPENYSKKIHPPTTIRKALAKSMNLVSIRLLRAIEIEYGHEYLAKFGMPKEHLAKSLSLALGTGNITPMELNTAYAALANNGYLRAPHFISRIESRDGTVIYEQPVQRFCSSCSASEETAPRIMPANVSFVIDDMLKDVVRYGTARKAQVINRADLAGKTGTTNDYIDAWFNGYGGGVVTTTWIGFDQPQTLGYGEAGGRAALPIWIDFMQSVLKNRPISNTQRPNTVSLIESTETEKDEFQIFSTEHGQQIETLEAQELNQELLIKPEETKKPNSQIEELF